MSDSPHSLPPQARQALEKIVLAMPMAQFLGLKFIGIERGEVTLEIPYRQELSFRPGQMQATAIFAAADFAAIAAAGTTLQPGWINASIDCTLKIVGPANGDRLVARGRVITPGKLITVCAADVFSVRGGEETLCATALATARNIEIGK
ncbi:PaaI family thioesterase [Noviherbaspirillum sp.]|uniref:PaaI family thioesterase n=1 Tax=Noviherbaspirillum sp. TaxID=1926288 RepID=UPI002FE2A7D4